MVALLCVTVSSLQTPELRGAMAVCALAMLEEGFGDEVTLIGGVFLLVLAMVLAWLSTHVAENGDHMIGTIISGVASVPLVGLGNSDPYRRATASSDPVEPQPPTHLVDKPEDEASGLGSAGGGEDASLEDATGPTGPAVSAVDQHLDIQGLHKRTVAQSPASTPIPFSLPSEESQDTERGKHTGGTTTTSSSSSAADIKVRLKFLNDTEELATLRPQDTIGLLKR